MRVCVGEREREENEFQEDVHIKPERTKDRYEIYVYIDEIMNRCLFTYIITV